MNVEFRPDTRTADRRLPFECVALALQGGGALGADQAGVYEALAEANLNPDWVAGASIGAINPAINAGNEPAERVAKVPAHLCDDPGVCDRDRLHNDHSLREALEANQHLLQEMQHRVKNHIAMMTSLIRLRARETKSEETRQALSAVGERIDTLRLVHEQLYMAGTTDRLRLRPFIMQLVEKLCSLHEAQSGKVRLDFVIEDADLPPEVAVPLGLILNEFVTNSLKYAFDGRGGAIGVTVERREGRGGLRVRISDNGKGLPQGRPEAILTPGSGTGMSLIDALARQIGAKPIWSSQEPTGTALCLEVDRS